MLSVNIYHHCVFKLFILYYVICFNAISVGYESFVYPFKGSVYVEQLVEVLSANCYNQDLESMMRDVSIQYKYYISTNDSTHQSNLRRAVVGWLNT